MRDELRNEMLRILEEAKGKPEGIAFTFGRHEALTFEAIDLLDEMGALSQPGKKQYKITRLGYEYCQDLKPPPLYWFRQNWKVLLPVLVTLVLGSIGIVVALLRST